MTVALVLLSLVIAEAAPTTQSRDTGALQQLAANVAQEAANSAAEAPLALHVRSDSAELSEAFSTLLCGQLSSKRLSCVPLEKLNVRDAEPAARGRGARSLLRVSLTIEHGLIHARGDLIGTWVNFWSGATPTRPASPAAALERSVDADAFAVALFSAPLQSAPPPQASTTAVQLAALPFARVSSWTAAIGAGDLDGDRKAEIVAITDDELFVFSPEGKLLAKRELKSLPLSPTPSREPFGFVSVLPAPARIRAITSRRVRGETLAFEKGVLRALPVGEDIELLHAGRAVVTAQPQPGTNTANVLATFDGEAPLALTGGPFTTVSAFALPTAGGWVLAVNADGVALLTNGPGRELRLDGLASASALVDLDGDGSPELASTVNEYNPTQDEVRIYPLPQSSSPGDFQLAAKYPVSRGRVLQLAGADVDADGAQELIAASWLPDGTTELQIFRRRAP